MSTMTNGPVSDEFDVAVVGAGPAGATAAYYFGRAALKTLLIDKAKFPRDKSCGDAVCAKSVRLLRDMQLEEALAPYFVPRGQRFSNSRGDALDLPFAAEGDLAPAYVVQRRIFDDILFRHAQRQLSVTTMEEVSLVDLVREGHRVAGIVAKDGQERLHRFRTKLVVGADGAMSRTAEKVGAYDFQRKSHEHWIGAFRIYYENVRASGNRIEIHFLEDLLPGYLWIFPLGGGLYNVGAGMVESYLSGQKGGRKINLRETVRKLLASHPTLRERFAESREIEGSFRGWQLPCGSERRTLVGPGWALVGDAASLIDPFSGEGIGNAIFSGRLVAEIGARAIRDGDAPAPLVAYERRIWDELGPELDTAYRLQKMVASDWQRPILDFLVARASQSAGLRETIGRLMVRHETSKLANLAFCARLLVEDVARSATNATMRMLRVRWAHRASRMGLR